MPQTAILPAPVATAPVTTAPVRDTPATDEQRLQRLYQAADASMVGGELIKRIYHLGRPQFTHACRTACICFAGTKRLLFLFSRKFFDGLPDEPLVFVLLHESLHLAFAHHRRRQNRMQALWNIACDLVVNQFLLGPVGFAQNRSPQWRQFIASAITFQNLGLGGSNAGDLSAEQAYELLSKELAQVHQKTSNLQACDEHPWVDGGVANADHGQSAAHSPDSTEDLSPDEDTEQAGGEKEDGEEVGGEVGEEVGEENMDDCQMDEVSEQLRQIFHDWMPGWSPTGSGELRAVLRQQTPIVDWERILVRRIENAFQIGFEQRWAPPNRKIAWLFPQVLLPAERELERPRTSVLLAIDASGSISSTALDRLVAISRSLPPDRAEVQAISFDTVAHVLDLQESMLNVRGGGGTSFQCVEEYANSLPKYPGLIVVLTDGLAPTPEVRHPGRWFWLITEDGIIDHVQSVGTVCMIAEVLR